MRTYLAALLLSVFVATLPAVAGTCIVTGAGPLTLQLSSLAPLQATPAGAIVSGAVVVTPREALTQGLTAIYYLDDEVKLVSEQPRPELKLDTQGLVDGLHELRLEVSHGTQLAMSTGSLALQVANDAATAAVAQAAPGDPPFVKLYRKLLLREIVGFNGREADLEKHAWLSHGRVFITLTDLMRHVGGTIIWGPSQNFIVVERNGIEIHVIPGSARVLVNGERASLGQAARRIDNRTYVPIRPMLALLGIETVDWDSGRGRAYVATK